jgi:hypothetical protein
MPKQVADLFEEELRRREIAFQRDPISGRYSIQIFGRTLRISLDNLERGYRDDGDAGQIITFVDAVLSTPAQQKSWPDCRDSVYFALESELAEAGLYRDLLTDRLNRVLVSFNTDKNLLSYVFRSSLTAWNTPFTDIAAAASANLGRALRASTLNIHESHGVRIGFLDAPIPFKSALILAPNLREIVSPQLGWPLLAVVPDRDFLLLWNASHLDLVRYLGGTVIKEFETAPYPLTTEVLQINDGGIMAVGAF